MIALQSSKFANCLSSYLLFAYYLICYLFIIFPGTPTDNPFAAHPTHIAQVGISVERLDVLSQQTPVVNSTPSNAATYAEFTQKMAENFFNFAGSFALTQAQMTVQPNETFVPFNVVEQWYNNTKRKMEMDPNWWKK